MILTSSELRRAVDAGDIVLDPFCGARVNPNSYNYTLHPELHIAQASSLDPRSATNWTGTTIDEKGIVLLPGRLYLGSTIERIGSNKYVPLLVGRSSLGRLGMFLQASCDLGNLGAIHRWTLEISVVQPLRVYAGTSVGQVSFWRSRGAVVPYLGRYGQHNSATPNQNVNRLLHREEPEQ